MIDFKSFHKLSYGLYLICSEWDGKKAGYAGNTGFQVTADPSTIAISSNKENFTTDIISKSKKFSLSVLQKDLDIGIIGDFGFKSSKDIDKFAAVYTDYFNKHTNGQLSMLDPAPRWAVWPRHGAIAFGKTVKENIEEYTCQCKGSK